jgi:hypothetical protein
MWSTEALDSYIVPLQRTNYQVSLSSLEILITFSLFAKQVNAIMMMHFHQVVYILIYLIVEVIVT